MANIQVIAEHSVDLDLLTGGIVIDAGCLGFEFSKAMVGLGCQVHAFDIQEIDAPEGITFHHMAVSNYDGGAMYEVNTIDKQATKIGEGNLHIEVVDLFHLIFSFGGEIDLLKLDIEGEEFKILSDPRLRDVTYLNCPRQLSFELHQHTGERLDEQKLQLIWNNLSYNYSIVHCDYSRKHGCPENYWDVLAIRKDLI